MTALRQQIGWFLNYTVLVSPYYEGHAYLEINGPPAPIVKQQNGLLAGIMGVAIVGVLLGVIAVVLAMLDVYEVRENEPEGSMGVSTNGSLIFSVAALRPPTHGPSAGPPRG